MFSSSIPGPYGEATTIATSSYYYYNNIDLESTFPTSLTSHLLSPSSPLELMLKRVGRMSAPWTRGPVRPHIAEVIYTAATLYLAPP